MSDLSPLASLTQLNELTLHDCEAVSDLAPLSALTQLTKVEFNKCSGVKMFGPLLPVLSQLTILELYDCNFADLPSSAYSSVYGNNVIDEVRAYFADLEAGERDDAEVKLFVLGNGGVGKTQLRRQLCGNKFDDTVPTTHGVELDRFEFERDGALVRANLWDFGGQDIYHGTHALFLDGHAVFVVLWHPEFEYGEFTDRQSGVRMRNRPLAYWLDYVRAQAGPDAVVLLVQARADSRADEHPLPKVDTAGLRVRTLAISSLTGRGLGALREQINEAVGDLLEARPPYKIGIGRAKVRDRLRAWLSEDQSRPAAERTHRTITTEEFAALCAEVGGVSSAEALLNFLHRSGVVFYRPGQFGDRIILDQQWALDAIYTVFNRASVLPNLYAYGRFTRSDLAENAWHQYEVAEQELFLVMMLECDICFELMRQRGPRGEEALHLAPELLPDPNTIQHVLRTAIPRREPSATAVARFAFLHDGVLRSVLAALGREFKDLATYWKWGCSLYDERADCTAVLEVARGGPTDGPGGGTITVRAWGDRPDSVLQALMAVVNRAAGRQEPEWKSSRKRDTERVEPDFVITDRGDGKPVFVPGIAPSEEAVIGISYGHGDEHGDVRAQNRKRFVDGLERAMRDWGFSALRDINELAHGGLIREFVPKLVQRADGLPRRVVLVLSDKYLRSIPCMAELHAVYQLSLSNRAAFARYALPCVIETDLKIDQPEDREVWAAFWRRRHDAIKGAVCDPDFVEINRWVNVVAEMLDFVRNKVEIRGYEALTARGFAAVKAMLERADSK